MDTSRLRFGETIAAASAVILFIVMFLDWYGVKGTSIGASAWKVFSYTDLICLLAIIVAIGLALLTMSRQSVALPVAASVITTVIGGIAALLVLYRIINQPGPNDIVTVKFWAYIGFLAAAGIAVGGYQSMREEGTTFGDAAGGVRRPAPTPAPAAGPPTGARPQSTSQPVAPGSPPPPPAAPPAGEGSGPPPGA